MSLFDWFGSGITTFGFLKEYKIKEGDIVIDCGAYLGFFAIYAAKKAGEKGRIFAFEPDPKNYKILERNVSLSGQKNITIINKALFNKTGNLSWNSSSTRSSYKNNGPEENKVFCATLDSELERLNINKVDFIKMDIEGAEIEALEGAKDTMIKTSSMAIACYHKRNGITTNKILEPILKKIGFALRVGFFLHPTLYCKK